MNNQITQTIDAPRPAEVSLATREQRVRRKLASRGFGLCKTPSRSGLREYYGAGYMICEGNIMVEGCGRNAYEATIEDVERFVANKLN